MAICNQCGKGIGRGKWCSDRCRMANKRANKPEHEQKVGQAVPMVRYSTVMVKDGQPVVSKVSSKKHGYIDIRDVAKCPKCGGQNTTTGEVCLCCSIEKRLEDDPGFSLLVAEVLAQTKAVLG